MSALADRQTPTPYGDMLTDTDGADLLVEQLDDLAELAKAAQAAYGRPFLRTRMEGGDLTVTIHARGVEGATYGCAGFEMWTDEFGRRVRWDLTYRDEAAVGIVWTVIG